MKDKENAMKFIKDKCPSNKSLIRLNKTNKLMLMVQNTLVILQAYI